MALTVEWVGPPRSFTAGRRRAVQFIVLHYTAGSEGPTSAEGGAAYDKRRTDGTSTHYFTDSVGPALQEVRDGDRAHTARFHGNEIGIQIEICGTRQTAAQWADAASRATLETTAALCALLCRRHGLPVRRLTTAQTRAAYFAPEGQRPKGITDHNACTFAFPEDQGDHTDVGPGFPWEWFMARVEAYYQEDEDMQPTDQLDIPAWMRERWAADPGMRDGKMAVASALVSGYGHGRAAREDVAALAAKVAELSARPPVEADELLAAVKSALTDPAVVTALATAINADAARRLAE